MQKKLSHTVTKFLMVVGLAVLAFAPLNSQAITLIPGSDLGPLGDGQSANFAALDIGAGAFSVPFEFDYVGTAEIFVAAAAPRIPDNPPFVFGIDDFRFTVGLLGMPPIWDSVSFSDEVIGRVITQQELALAGIASGDTLVIAVSGEDIGTFPSGFAGSVGVVPEPSTMLLFGVSLIGLAGIRRRLKRN